MALNWALGSEATAGPMQRAGKVRTAIAAPKDLSKAVAEKIAKDIEAAINEPDIRERFTTFGYEPFPTTMDQFGKFVASESAKYADVVKRAKIALD